MSQMIVRNIPEEQYEALKRIAAENNRSAEAEVRQAIAMLVRRRTGQGFGTMLKEKYAGVLPRSVRFERNKHASDPMSFE